MNTDSPTSMPQPITFDLPTAQGFAAAGEIAAWVHAYLEHGAWANLALSDGLRRGPRWWRGPVEVPLDRLIRCTGPEAGMEYPQPVDEWESRIRRIDKAFPTQQDMPPLLVEYRAGVLSLRDGNHRHEAIRRKGWTTAWVIVWYNSQADFDRDRAVGDVHQPKRSSMTESALFVAAGEDRLGAHRGLGISAISFKVLPTPDRDVLIIENTFHAPGGPARHLHTGQDEWFYAAEGEFVLEVGAERFHLKPGDSVMAPRNIPHVWAFVGQGRGRMVITFFPAGKMVAFFEEVTKANAMPPRDPALWQAHDMELLGPPLALG